MSWRERSCEPIDLPASLAPLVLGYRWGRNAVGESGAALYRLHKQGREPDLYLKTGREAVAGDIADEMVRLRWLGAHIAVPQVRHFSASPDEAWLLTTALPGRTANQCLEEAADRTPIVAALARSLRRLHALPVETCPFNADHRMRLAYAHGRMEAGLVDIEDFDEARRGRTARQVWDEMIALLPFAPDPVVTHGDFSLDNILLEDGEVTGLIDVGRAGIADRYQDLAILWNCLGDFGPALREQVWASYGIREPDEAKLGFHLALDEFF